MNIEPTSWNNSPIGISSPYLVNSSGQSLPSTIQQKSFIQPTPKVTQTPSQNGKPHDSGEVQKEKA